MLVGQMGFELLDGLELDLVFRLGRLTALLPLVAAAFADGAGDPAHRPYHPVMVSVVEPHLRGLVVPVLPGLALAGRGRQRREIADRLGAVPHFLGGEDGGAVGHAEAAALVAEDEAEAGDAGGADLAVAAGAVGHPFEPLRADGAGVVHVELHGGGGAPAAGELAWVAGEESAGWRSGGNGGEGRGEEGSGRAHDATMSELVGSPAQYGN